MVIFLYKAKPECKYHCEKKQPKTVFFKNILFFIFTWKMILHSIMSSFRIHRKKNLYYQIYLLSDLVLEITLHSSLKIADISTVCWIFFKKEVFNTHRRKIIKI